MKTRHTIYVVCLLMFAAFCLFQISGKEASAALAPGKTKGAKRAEKLSHENAFVTMSFQGLMAMCLNNSRQAEIGILKDGHHKLTVEIKKITLDGEQTINFPVDPAQDV